VAAFPTVPPDMTRALVLERCRYFTRVGLWPTIAGGVDPEAWLDNFDADEEPFAVYLLNAFLYFADHVMDRVFVHAFQALSRPVMRFAQHATHAQEWADFVDTCVVTAVRGERPAPTDSGSLFVRRARGLLGIPKGRILEQADAIAAVRAGRASKVVFVDDFVGTGNQLIDTFGRAYEIGGEKLSFKSLADAGIGTYYYCPIAATARGTERIRRDVPQLQISAGHILPDRYSALHPESLIWPEHLRGGSREFIYKASVRAGIPDAASKTEHWEGFGQLGLALGFAHGTPDATLPIIWWAENGWTPLRGRQ
jgi:hypothetical protein